MPPRHTKSEFASFLLPAWMIGKNPKLKIIQTTHTAELAVRFGRKAKTLIDSEDYQKIFQTRLREDSQAAGRWETEQGGEYFAAGVGGAITGRGADLLIIDDPHSEQDAMNPEALERAYEWYTSGPRQRLQPGGKIVVVMTRWSVKDLTAQLIKSSAETKADQWLDAVLVVSIDEETQRKRVMSRNDMNEKTFDLILSKQLPDKIKRDRADYIIETNSIVYVQEQVQSLVKKILGNL